MPISPAHDIKSSEDEFHRHSLVQEIAHGVYEDGLRLLPLERQLQGACVEGKFEAIRVVRLTHGLESQRHPLRIAVLASGADLRAPRERVPSGLRPLNCGVRRHNPPRPARQTVD